MDIKENPWNGGLYAFFKVGEQEYFADVADLGYCTECMIFKSENGKVIDWGEEYARRDIPVTAKALKACINEFIEGLKTNTNN